MKRRKGKSVDLLNQLHMHQTFRNVLNLKIEDVIDAGRIIWGRLVMGEIYAMNARSLDILLGYVRSWLRRTQERSEM